MPRAPSDPTVMAAVSAYLTELSIQERVTQKELAERAGVSQTLVSEAKTGKKATEETVDKIATAMGVLVDDILSGAALAELKKSRAAAPVKRAAVPTSGEARTEDPLFWSDFAKRPGNDAFDDVVEATRARAVREKWPDGQLDAVLNVAAKAVGRNYGGRPPTHSEARAGVARGVAVVIEGRDPDDIAPPKADAAMAPAPPLRTPTLAESLAKPKAAGSTTGTASDKTLRPRDKVKLGRKD